MHDTFNLAWKLNLVIRGLAKPSLLSTYQEERQKIARDLITFDMEHCKAFSQGDDALARNFDENIRFIAGIGAEYSADILNRVDEENSAHQGLLRPGGLLVPAQVTRYIDANPVDVQFDVPLLSQFRIYVIIPSISIAEPFLSSFCAHLDAPDCSLHRLSSMADESYEIVPRALTRSDEFRSPLRYTAVSQLFTFALFRPLRKQTSKSMICRHSCSRAGGRYISTIEALRDARKNGWGPLLTTRLPLSM